MTLRGDVWASFDSEWIANGTERPFDEVQGWSRLGEVPTDQVGFWKAVRLQQFGGSPGRWKHAVDFYALVYQDSPSLDLIRSSGFHDGMEDRSVEHRPFWLGLDAHGRGTLMFVSSETIGRGARLTRPPEPHPGRIGPPVVPVSLRLTLASTGTYFERAF